MFLSQVRLTPGMHLAGLADLMPARARERLAGVGWPQEQFAAKSLDDALKCGKTFVTDDAMAVIAHPEIDVVIEATGDPASGIKLCLEAIRHGKHIIMVNVEADALAGPLLARRAREAGVVYSLAWGDQPALIAEHVDWARACGFQVVSAGKGTRYHPSYHQSTPDTVWDILTQYLPIKDRSHINPKMFNSFLDGTKSGIEMTAVCNATGLVPQTSGLSFPPASRFELADVCKPRSEGGTLEKKGVTEVVSSLYRDGKDVPHHLAMGTYVVIESESPYAAQCFVEYNCLADKSGKYATMYRPTHMIGLELGFQWPRRCCARSRRARRCASTRMWLPRPSARSRPARCWTARAVLPCGASRCRPMFPSRKATCRSGLPTPSSSRAISRKASRSGGRTWLSMRAHRR